MNDLQIYDFGIAPNIWTQGNEKYREVEHFPNGRQIAICQSWLAGYAMPAKSKCCPKSSYWLKHRVEAMTGKYISNGALIAAGIAMGFEYEHRPNSINVGFFMNLKPIVYKPIQGRN